MKSFAYCSLVLLAASVPLLAADATCTPITTATTEDCSGNCPDAVVSACPGPSEAEFFPQIAYKMKLNVSGCLPIFPKGCLDQRATCECSNGAATCADSEKQCDIILRGNLWVPKPSKKGGYPVVIFNHGSVGCGDGQTTCAHAPGEACSLAAYFVSKGYAFFAPIRRGYSPSTGTYFSEWNDFIKSMVPVPDSALFTMAMQNEAFDVIDAVHFLQTPNNYGVDANRIAIIGHSLGGIVTLFTNENDLGQKTAVSIAGDSESWCGGGQTMRDALFNAVDHAKSPIYFFEPRNDVATNPTIELSHEAGLRHERYAASIFGEVVDSKTGDAFTCGKHAHVCFVVDENQVKRWGPSALAWLERWMK